MAEKQIPRGIKPFTPDMYQPTLMNCYAFCAVILQLPLADMIKAGERAASTGAIMDPTLYRAKGKALEEDLTMLRALQHVQSVMGAMHERFEAMIVEAKAGAGGMAVDDAATDKAR